jgi:hypothetical protein
MNDAYSFQISGWWQNNGTFQSRHNFKSGIQVFWNTDIQTMLYVSNFGNDRMCAIANMTATY